MRLLLRTGVLALVIVLLVIVFLYTRPTPSLQNANDFEELPLNLAHFGLFDLGIADVNQDKLLDIYTSNHSGPQSILTNLGQGRFKDEFFTLKLHQDQSFPGLAVLPKESPATEPGIYISWQGPSIVIRAYKKNSAEKFVGKIEVMSPLKVEHENNINVVVKHDLLANGVTHSIINFDGAGDGYFTFKPYLHALPIQFKFGSDLTPNSIFVGPHYISPSSLEFSINMRDRHGMAWADYNNDGLPDLFITRGGQKGWVGRMPGSFWDELFVTESGEYHNIGAESGLIKDDCSGRQAAWVDYNADNRLDVYVACGKASEYQSNKLYEQMPDGRFKDVAQQAGLDIGPEGSFIWVDADSDGDLDLFWVDNRSFYLYENISGKFSPHRLGANPARHVSKKLSIADFDSDGDLDIFSASPKGNALCINIGGDFIIADPTAWGLAKKSMTANWVDYDNDGLLDLHTIPDGLYQQKSPGKYIRTSVLSISNDKFSYNELKGALASWFDMNNDGTRDLILALDYKLKKKWWAKGMGTLKGTKKHLGGLKDYWQPVLVRNKSRSTNHWLQIELVGLSGNRPAIGSTVTVSMSDSEQQMQQVGMSEGSQYSQGHYRLYFGLGEIKRSVDVRVTWPDGYSQEIYDIEPDQLLFVKRQELHAG